MDAASFSPISLVVAAVLVAAPALLSAAILAVLHPLLLRIALVKPNARSSHARPTPQGGGVGVVAAATLVVAVAGALLPLPDGSAGRLVAVFAAALLLAAVGAVDDTRGMSTLPRLAAQFAAMALVLATLPADWQLLPLVPWWLDRVALLIAGVWFVNLVNFMDGIDWMTVAELVPVSAGLALMGAVGALPKEGALVALVLGGAVAGFAPYNRPVARLFLGDVGSLPLGLLLGWLLLLLASRGHVAAALLLPLYYLADATLTLLRRLARGERVWEAHRTHFYQRATDRGFTVPDIVARVFAINVGLVLLATATVLWPAAPVQAAALGLGCLGVGWLLYALAAGKR